MSTALTTLRASLAALHLNASKLLVEHAQAKAAAHPAPPAPAVSEADLLAVAKDVDALNEKVVAALNAPAPSTPNNPLAGHTPVG